MHALLRFVAAGFLLAGFSAAPARAALFMVDSVDDTSDANPGDGLCDDGSGACTLRAAIEEANGLAGADRIEFALAAPAATILSAGSLDITDALTIDGYTQAGSAENTLAFGSDAAIAVVIDGGGAGVVGFSALQQRVILRGLAVRGFDTCVGIEGDPISGDALGTKLVGSRVESCQTGVLVTGRRATIGGVSVDARNLIASNGTGVDASANAFIVNNSIGTDAAGRAAQGNTIGVRVTDDAAVSDNLISGNLAAGLLIEGARNQIVRNRIGTTADGAVALANTIGVDITASFPGLAANLVGTPSFSKVNANLISGNDVGIRLGGTGGNRVQGNYIGTGPLGVSALPNRIGIEIVNSSGNVIGAQIPPASAPEGNVIAYNSGAGISVPPDASTQFASTSNSFRGNRIFGNAFDIDLNADGIVNDDPRDVDLGPNDLQNPPRVQSAFSVQGQTDISGVIDVRAGSYTLDFYSSTDCDAPPDSGSGEFFIGSAQITASPTTFNPLTPFSVSLPATAQGAGVSGMASEGLQSSEFGPCALAASSGRADLELTLDPLPATHDPGDPVSVRVRLRNLGPAAASNVAVFVPPPPALFSWSSTSPSSGAFDSVAHVWNVPALAAGASEVLDLGASVPASAVGFFTVNAGADQNLSELDPDLTNNRAVGSSVVRSGADLVLTLTPAAVGAPPGGTVPFDITVTNLGPELARDVRLTGHLDRGLELGTAPVQNFAYDAVTRRWTYLVGDLAEGDTETIQLSAVVDPTAAVPSGPLHQVWAFAAGGPADATPNHASAIVGVPLAADLAIEDLRFDNATATWTSTVVNHGPDAVDGIEVLRFFADGVVRVGGLYRLAPNAFLVFQTSGTRVQLGVGQDSGSAVLYHELSPNNNAATGLKNPNSPTEDCGLLGIEAPIFLGVVALSAGRRGRRLRDLLHLRGRTLGALLAAALAATSPDIAHAASLTLAIDSAASSASLSLATPLGTPAPVPVTLSGNVSADVTLANDALFGLHAANLQLMNGAVALSDASILLESFPLYSLTLASQGLVTDLSGPARSGFAVAPGLSLFDLFGGALTFGTGVVSATGDYFGAPVNESLDLATFPFTSFFPLNSVAEARVVDLGGGQVSIELRIPFSAPLQLAIDDTQNTLTIAGTLVLVATAAPEPAASLLLALGGAALLAITRRGATPS